MVLVNNGSLTVYRYNVETSKYSRINIPIANIKSKRNATVTDKGVNVFYSTFIVIDSIYTIKTGDKIVLETLSKDIEKIKDLQGYEVLTVVGVQNNPLFRSTTIEAK